MEAKGIRCWIAPRDVIPGQEWGAAIVDAIRSSRVMVLVFSSHANASPQVRREVERAVNAETVLIPFRIEDVAPAQSLEFFLGTPHWLDAMTRPFEAHLERLAAAITRFLAVTEPAAQKLVGVQPAYAGIEGQQAPSPTYVTPPATRRAKVLQTIEPGALINAVAWDPDGRRLVVATNRDTISARRHRR